MAAASGHVRLPAIKNVLVFINLSFFVRFILLCKMRLGRICFRAAQTGGDIAPPLQLLYYSRHATSDQTFQHPATLPGHLDANAGIH